MVYWYDKATACQIAPRRAFCHCQNGLLNALRLALPPLAPACNKANSAAVFVGLLLRRNTPRKKFFPKRCRECVKENRFCQNSAEKSMQEKVPLSIIRHKGDAHFRMPAETMLPFSPALLLSASGKAGYLKPR